MVPSSSGLPGTSRWPTTRIQLRSSSVLMMFGIDRDAADLFDLAARDRLPVGDQRQRLEQRARILGRPLLPQARDRLRHRGADLNAVAARDLDQLQSAGLVFGAQRLRAPPAPPRRPDPSRSSNSVASSSSGSGRPAASSAASITFRTYWSFIEVLAVSSLAASSSATSRQCRAGLPSRTCRGA